MEPHLKNFLYHRIGMSLYPLKKPLLFDDVFRCTRDFDGLDAVHEKYSAQDTVQLGIGQAQIPEDEDLQGGSGKLRFVMFQGLD